MQQQAPFLLKIESFGEFLKSRLELFQDSGSDNVDLFIICHIKIRRRLDIDQQVFGLVVFENDRLSLGIRNARDSGKILVRLRRGNNGIGVILFSI